jgi:putative ABC transport system permease protein
LAGMIFSSGMNAVSLAAERLVSELKHDNDFVRARNQAFQTSMIPMLNSLFAVGLVALPGMMTGQILSGVSPLIAVRYQIMVMFMTFAAAGISSAVFLVLSQRGCLAASGNITK